jgi:8-oxo-dGTP pyrophosphatase MutT (NUDIX family)
MENEMIAGDGNGARKWSVLSSLKMYECNVFSVFERESRGPDGRVGRFAVMEAKDWAVVVPYVRTENGTSFLMVRQYRHGADEVSLEFPGGVVEPLEEPAHAAARELAEETGWVSAHILHAGTVFPNPAIQDNHFHVFVALDPEPKVTRNLDSNEIIDAHLMPADEIRQKMGTGELRHALMVTALFLADKCVAALGEESMRQAKR